MVRVLCMLLACFLLCGLGRASRFLDKPQRSFKQTLHNFMDTQYFTDLDIGGETISGLLDTGSSELIVRSTRCERCNPIPRHTDEFQRYALRTLQSNDEFTCTKCFNPNAAAYDPNKSLSFKQGDGTTSTVEYMAGIATTTPVFDTVSVGELKAEKTKFFEIVKHMIPALEEAAFAAIVGVAPNSRLFSDALLSKFGTDRFSVCLQMEKGLPGYLTWGPSEAEETGKMAKKDFATVKSYGTYHWTSTMKDVSFSAPGGRSKSEVMPCGVEGCNVNIDSGFSLISAPVDQLKQLEATMRTLKADCSNLHEMPSLHFQVDGHDLELPPHAYVMRLSAADMAKTGDEMLGAIYFKPLLTSLTKTNQDTCVPVFMANDLISTDEPKGPVWILGMPFFRYYHTTFDRKEKTMHLAKVGPDCEPVPFNSVSAHKQTLLTVGKVDRQPLDLKLSAIIPYKLSGTIHL